MNFLQEFEQEAHRGDLADVEQMALCIAGAAYPNLDLVEVKSQLDDLAFVVERGMPENLTGRPRAEAFVKLLSAGLGFVGNREDYYDPRNSFLNDVLDRRMGLPITLSLVCIALGRRLNMPIHGVGYPGHFMAGLRDGGDLWLLDLFTGRVLSPQEVPGHLATLFQQPLNFVHQMGAAPISPISLVRRILNNLWNIYHGTGEQAGAAWVLDYMLALTPDDPRLWQERGVVALQMGRLHDAARSLRRCLYLSGHLERYLGLEEGVILEDLDGTRIELGEDELADGDVEGERGLRGGGYRPAPPPSDDDEVWQILGMLGQIDEDLQRLN